MKPLELILLFAPTSPRQPVPKFSGNFGKFWDRRCFTFCRLPAQVSPEIFGAGNIWRLFAALFAPKFSGNFGTGDAASRDCTIPEFSRKFWDAPSQIFQEFWNEFFLISRQISRKFRSHEIFRKFRDGRRSTLSRLPAQIFLEILRQETFVNYSLCFLLPNSAGILAREMLHCEITRNVKFLGNFGAAHSKFPGNFGTFFLLSRVKFLGNFVHTKFSDKFGTGALGLYSEILRKFWGSKFPGNFGTGNIWQLFAVFLLPNSPGILAQETLLREITRNVKFLGWNGAFKFSRNFLGNLIDAKFTDKFGTGALGLYSKILRVFLGR